MPQKISGAILSGMTVTNTQNHFNNERGSKWEKMKRPPKQLGK
jgi:hypothetical protein